MSFPPHGYPPVSGPSPSESPPTEGALPPAGAPSEGTRPGPTFEAPPSHGPGFQSPPPIGADAPAPAPTGSQPHPQQPSLTDFPPPQGPASELVPQGSSADMAPAQPQPDTVAPLASGQAATKHLERPSPLTGLANSWVAVFGFVFIIGREFLENGFAGVRELGPIALFIGLAVGAVALLSLLWGVIEWRTTRFVADTEEFRIERNFLSKDSRRISYAKIQSVDIQRSLVARLLGLASVSIDVGGGESTKLQYLSIDRANGLRDHLLKNMRSLQMHAADEAGHSETPDAPVAAAAPEPALLLLAVKTSTLILGAVVSNFLIMLVMLVLGLGASLINNWGSIAAGLPLIIGVASYLFSRIVGNLNFRIERVSDGLRISRGFFSTSTRSLRADRIQAVAIRQDAIQKLTGLYRMNVTVLGGGLLGNDAETTSTVLPYGSWEDVRTVLGAFWPGINLDTMPTTGQPERARWLTPLAFRNHRWGGDEHTLMAQRGWLNREITVVPHRRMQSIGLSQGPLQRALRVATVDVHTTTGPVRMLIQHMAQDRARDFLDEQVERARAARLAPGEPGYLTGFAPPAWPADGNAPPR